MKKVIKTYNNKMQHFPGRNKTPGLITSVPLEEVELALGTVNNISLYRESGLLTAWIHLNWF